ncbi:MAG: glutamate--tRNA ligase [Deltaproteobacteria bacterium]|nr:glutamate--tRNA ligase [Deltaproteobacteria bacterium]
MNKQVIVRFAPSPTGYLHIGGARTAIFNWLYAQKTGGKLVLRIEDTDVERSTEESIKGIIEGLKWLGISWDEGPYFQSQFIEDHKAAAQRLLESGHAYRCFCTKEVLEQKREEAYKKKTDVQYDGTCRKLPKEEVEKNIEKGLPFTIRLKVPEGNGAVRFSDIVYGDIEKKYRDIEDFVILRSNGQPLYVLSNAVDDIRDGITHIIRGQDGLANTPKQILIYQALGVPLPKFAHMPLTLDSKKAKISKRKHGEIVAVHFYREHGFLPWALVNFLALLGWSTVDSRQIFSKEELLDAFSLEGVNRSNSVFEIRRDDPKFFTDPKALAINSHYIKTLPLEELAPYVKIELEKAKIWDEAYETEKRDWYLQTLDLIRSRYHVTTDFITLGRAYFSDDYDLDPKALEKNVLKHEDLKEWLPLIAERLDKLDEYSLEETERVIREVAEELTVKPGVLINGIRTVVTGQAVGPGLFDVLMAIGRDRVVARLRKTPILWGQVYS